MGRHRAGRPGGRAGRATPRRPPAGDPLFGRFSFPVRYTWFRNWVNGPAGQRLGLAPIPGDPVTLRLLRRTLALELAYRPGGVLAAKIHLKHVSAATTEGYAIPARRRPGQAARRDRRARGGTKPAAGLTEFRNYQDGIMPAGPGARELTEFFFQRRR